MTGGDTAATRAAKALAKKNGLRLVLFTGGNLHVDGVGEVRGYITGDRVFVRADHPDFTADQIMRHEVGHDDIRKGKIDPDAVRERIADRYGEGGVEAVAELYASAYDGMTAEEAWEEIICDSLGDMNIFSGRLDSIAKPYQQMLENVRAAAENSARSERGPPSAESRASREYTAAIEMLNKGDLVRSQDTHIVVKDHTPTIYIQKAGAKNLSLLMSWESAYLAMKKSGDIPGHYHNLGPELMLQLPTQLEDPDFILIRPGGRINAILTMRKGNRPILVSVEMDAYQHTSQEGKPVDGNYNLIVTVMDAKPNYLRNQFAKSELVYSKNNEDPANFISRLTSSQDATLPGNDLAESSKLNVAQEDSIVKVSDDASPQAAEELTGKASRETDPETLRFLEDQNGVNIEEVPGKGGEGKASRETTELPGLRELEQQNEALRERVDYWKGQTKRTATPTLRQGDVDKMARSLVKDYASTADVKEISAGLKALGEYILRGGENGDELTWSGVKERAVDIARGIVENAEELNRDDADLYREVHGRLQQPMIISSQDAHDVSPDWGAWRNANRASRKAAVIPT